MNKPKYRSKSYLLPFQHMTNTFYFSTKTNYRLDIFLKPKLTFPALNLTNSHFIRRKPRRAKQPVIPKGFEPILKSAGIDENIAKRVLVESDKGKLFEDHCPDLLECRVILAKEALTNKFVHFDIFYRIVSPNTR